MHHYDYGTSTRLGVQAGGRYQNKTIFTKFFTGSKAPHNFEHRTLCPASFLSFFMCVLWIKEKTAKESDDK
jgi:hypothetical protein